MDLKRNANRFSGDAYTKIYDRYRPAPPKDMIQQSLNYLGKKEDLCIVDLGCGTGISTFCWAKFAKQLIGVEPSDAMRDLAEKKINKDSKNVSFISAFADYLPFQNSSVDLIAISQAFHWMEPKSSLKEINRVLKKGGLLLIYDCTWPPSFSSNVELAYQKLFQKIEEVTLSLKEEIAYKWPKKEHLNNITQSGHFSFIKEAQYHQVKNGDVATILGIALSQGDLEALRKRGFSEEEIGLSTFRKQLETEKGNAPEMIQYHYQVIFAKK